MAVTLRRSLKWKYLFQKRNNEYEENDTEDIMPPT
jgi:hypothetical protein